MKRLLLTVALIAVYNSFAAVIYVNENATGANDGTSWEDAYNLLQSATSMAADNDEIWIAAGTYKRTSGEPRGNSMTWTADNLNIYGGFTGTETEVNQRNWILNETIISGDINVPDNPADNSYTVMRGLTTADPKDGYLVDGLIIEDGYSNNPATISQKVGGAVWIGGPIAAVTYKNCVFRNNVALQGGAVGVNGSTVEMEVNIINCKFLNNIARVGAPFEVNSDEGEKVTFNVINCLFVQNQIADFSGDFPGLYGHGGRIIAYNGGDIEANLINCTWADNIDESSSTEKITVACVEAFAESNSELLVQNCIFTGNTNPDQDFYAPITGTTRYFDDVAVSNIITMDASIEADTETGVTIGSPTFTNAVAGDYSLTLGSNGVDAGSTSGIESFIPTTDLNNLPRISNGTIDIGCYEFQIDPPSSTSENIAIQLSIYPNPTSDWLNINTVSTILSLQIISLNGQILQTTSNTNQLYIENLAVGTYLIKVVTDAGIVMKKIQKI